MFLEHCQVSAITKAEGQVNHTSGKTTAYVEGPFYCASHLTKETVQYTVAALLMAVTNIPQNGFRKEECA